MTRAARANPGTGRSSVVAGSTEGRGGVCDGVRETCYKSWIAHREQVHFMLPELLFKNVIRVVI